MKRFFASFIFFLTPLLAVSLAGAEPGSSLSQRVRLPDALWGLNAAGQLVLRYDPFRDRTFPVRRVHTVVLNDREPKLCGDPDGTGRHTWFFTDALLIEVAPMNVPSTAPVPPVSQSHEP